MRLKNIGGLIAWLVMLVGGGAAIGSIFGSPWAGAAVGAGIFVVIILFVVILAAAFFGGVIYFFDSIAGKHQK